MRKLLAFLLLFGGGLLILARLEGEREAEAEDTLSTSRRAAIPPIPASAPAGVGVRGRFDVVMYDDRTNRALLRVASEDSRTEETADVLTNVQIDILDPDTEAGDALASIQAREALLPRAPSPDVFRPRYQNIVDLREVTALLRGALPVSDLEIRSPGARLDATDPSHTVLESDEALQFESPELRGTSTGYHIDIVRAERGDAGVHSGHGAEDLMELRRDGLLEFRSSTAEGEQGARFRATGSGALQVSRMGDANPRPIVLEGWEGARLELDGRFNPTLDAQHLRLRGTTSSGDELVRLESLDAEGDVLWTSSQGVYRAQMCTLAFDELSQPVSALLTGFPSVRFGLSMDTARLEGFTRDERRAVEELESVRIASEEEIQLELALGQGLAFRARGPATVETNDVGLRSNGDVIAGLSEDGRRISLEGSAGVEVETRDAALMTANFALTVAKSEEGAAALHGTAWDGTRLDGTTKDGRAFTVSSPERLEVERREGAWRIVEGRRVELSVGALGTPGAFFARCDRLQDFDVGETRFDAQGGVEFDGPEQRVVGERLLAHGPTHMEMWGSDELRVVYSSPEGNARAAYVEVDGDRLHARGEVDATVSSHEESDATIEGLPLDEYQLECAELFVLRAQADRGRTTERRLDVAANGDVRSTLVTEGRTIVLEHADEMIAEHYERAIKDASGPPLESTVRFEAKGDVRSKLAFEGDEVDIDCDELHVERSTAGSLEPAQAVRAVGNVRFAGTAEVSFRGEGDLLEIRPDRTATLSAPQSGRVKLDGLLPSREIPFRMTATQADFSADEIRAVDPDISIRGHRARGRSLVATRTSMRLEGDAFLSGSTSKQPWRLRSGAVTIAEDPLGEEELADLADRSDWDSPGAGNLLARLRAEDGFEFELGEMIVASGERLTSGRSLGVLRMLGNPTARISTPFGTYEAEWIEFDPVLQIVVETGPGKIHSRGALAKPGNAGGDGAPSGPGGSGVQEEEAGWTVDFLTSSTMYDGNDSLVYLIQEPTFRYPLTNRMLRASWVVLWLDRATWEGLASRDDDEDSDEEGIQPAEQRPAGVMGLFFDAVTKSNVAGLVCEAYFEGPVEAFEGDERVALADAVYLGLKSGRGYLVNAAVTITGQRMGRIGGIGEKLEQLSVKAKLLRHTKDGSLSADSATITPCSFDEPHVRIVTGDLRLSPLPDSPEGGYEVSLRDNRIEFDWLRIPLPPLEFDTDAELKPRLPSLRFGDTARFGQLLSIRLRGPAKKLGRVFDGIVTAGDEGQEDGGGEERRSRVRFPDIDARYDLDASYLGSRGALLDAGFTAEKFTPDQEGSYWFEFLTGIALDDGRDRGYVRVPRGEREYTRLWLRSQGWFDLGDNQRLITAYSDQSDPGVQSEFFESELSSHERDESYVQWKRADGNVWLQASVRPRIEEFKAAVEELPSATAYKSRASIGNVGAFPIVHTGDLRAAYLRRVEPRTYYNVPNPAFDPIRRPTEPRTINTPLVSPFGPSGVYPDGSRTRDTLRVDSSQMLELPIPVGLLGIKFIPFAGVRGTAWSTAATDDEATRVVTEAGARLTTVLWKEGGENQLHQVAPYVQYKAELASETDGVPHVFDDTETVLFGDFVQLGSRARFGVENGRSLVDIDVKATYASDRSDQLQDGWLPMEVFSSLGLGSEKRPLDVWYDTRFDTGSGRVVYSLFVVGTRFNDRAGVQVSHTYGSSATRKQFDAVSTSAFYRWTDKWEFEAKHSFSLWDEPTQTKDNRLGLDLLVRRYGHDAIFELEASSREGEGSSFGFGVRPRLGFRPSRIGLIFYR